MGRLLVLTVAAITPFVVYFLWLYLVKRKQVLAAEGRLPRWAELPWTWLIVAGVLIMGATLVAMRFLEINPDAFLGGESLIPPRQP